MNSIFDQIKEKINIVDVVSEYIDLQKKGKNYWGVCPFHEDTNPSMSVSPDKQMFKCFVCGKGGNVINFVSDYEKIPMNKAINMLAQRAGLEYVVHERKGTYNSNQEKIIAALRDANNFFMLSLNNSEGEEALKYAESRGLNSSIREKFIIGYSSDNVIDFLRKKGHDDATLMNASLLSQTGKPYFKNRLTFGIRNEFGDIIGFSSRLLVGDGPKYINSGESQVFNKSNILYNFSNANDTIQKTNQVYINEGFMDVIAMHKIGINNAIAIMGTALTDLHLRKLKDKEVILMLDSDDAGVKATLRSIHLLLKNNVKVKVVLNEDGKDPDEVYKTKGADELLKITRNQVTGLEFTYQILIKLIKPSDPTKIKIFIDKFTQFLEYGNDIEKDFYISKISNELGIGKESIKIKTSKVIPRVNRNKQEIKKEQNSTQQVSTQKQNYTYKLIKSMIKKPQFAKLLVKHNGVKLHDPVLLGIIKFLVLRIQEGRASISQESKEKLFEINDQTHDYAKNDKEFLDIVDIINKKWNIELKDKIKVKLKNTKDKKEIVEYLEQLRKIGK